MKIGLGQSYDTTIIDPKIRAYFDITKPASSVGIMFTVPFAAIIYGELYHTSGVAFFLANFWDVIFAAATMFLLHGGSQAMNMAEDAHIDKQTPHKQNRPIPAGLLTEEDARALAWIVIFVAVVRAFSLSEAFGVYAVVLAFFGIFYNLEPIRTKKRLWINLVWQATSRGLLLFPATFAVWGEMWNPVAWTMGIAAFLLVLSMQNTADFADVDVDEQFDIITPAVHHGLDDLVKIMLIIAILMFGFIAMAIYLRWIPNFWSLYLLIIPIGWSLWSLWNDPRDISEIGGNHTSWYVYYFSLASMYMLPAVQLTLL